MTFLSSAYNIQSLQKNSVFPDLLSDEVDALYSAYGDDTGVQCALRYLEFSIMKERRFDFLSFIKSYCRSKLVTVSAQSIQEFVKGCGNITKCWVDGLLDKMTASDHTKAVNQIRQVLYLQTFIIAHGNGTAYIHHPLPSVFVSTISNFLFQ